MAKTTTTQYDVTLQWTDNTREPGYRETIERAVVTAADVEAAFAAARAMRPGVSSVQLHGVHGSAVAFDGASWRRSYYPEAVEV